MNSGNIITPLTNDHKPCNSLERQRIVANGGQLYQSKAINSKMQEIIGPLRIIPGGLSVLSLVGVKNNWRCDSEAKGV